MSSLNPQQFFHGTDREFKPGDLIRSPAAAGHEPRLGKKSNNNYFTSSETRAGHYANMNGAEYRGEARVYEVRPLGSYNEDTNHLNKEQFRSKGPLAVVRKVSQSKPQQSEFTIKD